MERTLEDDRGRPPGSPELSARDRAEAWLFTGPAGRVFSFSVDMALAMPLLVAYGVRRAWRALPVPGRGSPAEGRDDQSSPAA